MTRSENDRTQDWMVGTYYDRIGLAWEAAYFGTMPTLTSPDGLSYDLLPKVFLEETALLFQRIFGLYPNTLVYQADDNLTHRAIILRTAAELGGLEVQSEYELHLDGWPQICLVHFPDPRGGDWDEHSVSIGLAA